MSSALPLRIDPLRLAEQRACLRGALPLARMARLGDALISREGLVHVTLRFSRNNDGLRVVAGDIEARLEMRCQRCLQPVTKSIERRFEWVLALGEAEADRLLAKHEVLEIGDQTVFTQDLIEDELLLSMPLIPVHADSAACDGGMLSRQTPRTQVCENAVGNEATRNPFCVLKDLKTS
ncbi:MAG: YceD family protein [Gammaproteobacteria bacterium]